jgi:aminotransferase
MNYEAILNRTLAGLKPSGIRRFFDIANELDDVISLSVGEPDFSTPWHIRQKGIETLEKGRTWYSPNAGFMRLREAIAAYTGRHLGVTYDPKSEVLVTVGGSEAIDVTFRALLDATIAAM